MLRDWREDRRRSQMDLALDVGVSTRHLSFVETGKSKPSPELVLALAEHLDVPLRERNSMLLAAGYAPRYPQTPLDGDVDGQRARRARRADPGPRPVPGRRRRPGLGRRDDQHRRPGRSSRASPTHLLASGPLNSYRITLHPEGMAPRIENFAEWAHHLLGTLDRQVAATRDPRLRDLLDEVTSYPNVAALGTSWRTRSETPDRRRAAAAARRRHSRSRGSRRTRRSARRSTSRSTSSTSSCSTPPTRPRRRWSAGARPDDRRPVLATLGRDGHHAGRDRRGGGGDRRRRRGAVAAAGGRGGRRRSPARRVAVQRAVVEPADPAAPGPPLGLTAAPWPSS